MARVEHIAMWTDDIDRLADFYARFFDARVGPKYENAIKGFESRFLFFEDGARLELMSTRILQPLRHAPGAQRMGLTHVAFALGTEERVDSLTHRLRDAGFAIVDGPRRTGDGYYESVVLDPDGNRVEVTA
jgi:lactoylglutathione lyase